MQFSKVLLETYRTHCSVGNAQNIRPTAFVDVRLPNSRHVTSADNLKYSCSLQSISIAGLGHLCKPDPSRIQLLSPFTVNGYYVLFLCKAE